MLSQWAWKSPGLNLAGSLQIKENDVYMREGCCSSNDLSEGRVTGPLSQGRERQRPPGELLPGRAAPGAGLGSLSGLRVAVRTRRVYVSSVHL